ncbi:hypothetical protein AMTRI_Chr12g267670 [Amborella trichopoda]
MLGKRSRPVQKGPNPLTIADTAKFSDDFAKSPTSPLDCRIRSPRGWESKDLEGIGLGIVAALNKTGETKAKSMVGSAKKAANLSETHPIPINTAKFSAKIRPNLEDTEIGCSESYCRVMFHVPKSHMNRAYNEGREERGGFDQNSRDYGVFCASSPTNFADFSMFPTADFLKSCYLCRKMLQGKDIYMYRGDKAFCSIDCRYRQIAIDEYSEKCSSNLSVSPYSANGVLSASVAAA